MRWGMSREDVRAAEPSHEWGSSDDAIGFSSVELDWGGEELRNLFNRTYVIYFFDAEGLCKIQFPTNCIIGDAETAAHMFGLARAHLSRIFGEPAMVDEAKKVAEWRTAVTTVTVRVDEEYDGPDEMGLFGFHYDYPAEHYNNRVPERYLRVIYRSTNVSGRH